MWLPAVGSRNPEGPLKRPTEKGSEGHSPDALLGCPFLFLFLRRAPAWGPGV